MEICPLAFEDITINKIFLLGSLAEMSLEFVDGLLIDRVGSFGYRKVSERASLCTEEVLSIPILRSVDASC